MNQDGQNIDPKSKYDLSQNHINFLCHEGTIKAWVTRTI